MRRGLGLLVLLLALAAAAAAYASTRGGDLRRPVTIRVQITMCGQPTAECGFIDLAPSGASLGDEFTFNVPISHHGSRVGTLRGVCSLISLAGNGTNECDTTFTLKGGTVQVAGLFHFGGAGTRSSFAVTGGSGFYRNARGQVAIINGTATNTAVLQLIP
jgi:allene oxide cyclase-like protein